MRYGGRGRSIELCTVELLLELELGLELVYFLAKERTIILLTSSTYNNVLYTHIHLVTHGQLQGTINLNERRVLCVQ